VRDRSRGRTQLRWNEVSWDEVRWVEVCYDEWYERFFGRGANIIPPHADVSQMKSISKHFRHRRTAKRTSRYSNDNIATGRIAAEHGSFIRIRQIAPIHPSNSRFFGSTHACTPKSISIVSPFLQGSTGAAEQGGAVGASPHFYEWGLISKKPPTHFLCPKNILQGPFGAIREITVQRN